MPDVAIGPITGFGEDSLASLVARDAGAIDPHARRAALARYHALPAPGGRPGRSWQHDLNKLDFSATESVSEAPAVQIRVDETAVRRGLIACDLAQAARDHAEFFTAAFGKALDATSEKFGSLAIAFQNVGAFISIPAGVAVEEPIEVVYRGDRGALFPYTLVVAGEGARATIIERLATATATGFVCGASEIVLARGATLTYVSMQEADAAGRTFMTRAARPGADAHVQWALAELGSALAVTTLRSILAEPGAKSDIAGLFFATGDQHVDLRTDVDHISGDTESQTLVKSVVADHAQARYYGNIAIVAHAHGSSASLKDDALILTPTAHVDSVPALEIAANDVRAFHGATVGALDEEQIFYLMSRGIARPDAERAIALGFFEPAVMRFPTAALRDELHRVLEAKVVA